METKANYAAVGLFVVVLLASGLAFLFWLTNTGERAKQMDVRIDFSDPVTGLYQGSSVLFNGIKVGEVSSLSLDANDPSKVIAIAKVDRSVPLKTDTRAILSSQGLTGVSNLQLQGGSRDAPLLATTVKDGKLPTIPAEVSPFQDIVESTRRVLNRADRAMGSIDTFITENKAAVGDSVRNIDRFTTALASNADGIQDLIGNVSSASKSIGKISTSLDGASIQLEQILKAVDPQQVRDLLAKSASAADNANKAAANLAALSGSIDPAQVRAMAADLRTASTQLRETTTQVQAALVQVSPQAVAEVTGNVRTSAQDFAAFSKGIREKTEDVQAILDQARSLVATLRTVSEKVDYFATKANGMLESKDGVGLFTQLGEAVTAVRDLSMTLNQKVGPMADNVVRFSDRGLANIDQLANDARRTLDLINRLVADIERNPQQFILGAQKPAEFPSRRY